jgi:hypothetical protein
MAVFDLESIRVMNRLIDLGWVTTCWFYADSPIYYEITDQGRQEHAFFHERSSRPISSRPMPPAVSPRRADT